MYMRKTNWVISLSSLFLSVTQQQLCAADCKRPVQGPPGPIGTKGVFDFNSLTSVAGLEFLIGPTGPTNPAGITGPPGMTGAQGLPGAMGATGALGPTGPAGETGATGAMGATGDPGLTGPQGAQGPTGAQGAQGATGAQGVQGATGAQGAQGATGPQGAQGLTGAQGAQGPTGPQGAQGPTGAQGAQGPTGPQGAQGPTGAQGVQGPTGLCCGGGLTGPEGAAGPQGPTGPAGPTGVTGSSFTTQIYATFGMTLLARVAQSNIFPLGGTLPSETLQPGQFNTDPSGRFPLSFFMPAEGIPSGVSAILSGGTGANQGLVTISVPGTYLITIGVAAEGGDPGVPVPGTTYASEAVAALRMGTSINTLTPFAGGYLMSRGRTNPLNPVAMNPNFPDYLAEDTLITTTFVIQIPTVPMYLDIANCNPSLMADGNNGIVQIDTDNPAYAPSVVLTILQIGP